MSPKKLLNMFTELQDELTKNGPSAQWLVSRALAVAMLAGLRVQIEHDESVANGAPPSDFFEGCRPLGAKNRAYVQEAYTLNRQIGKQLSALRKSK